MSLDIIFKCVRIIRIKQPHIYTPAFSIVHHVARSRFSGKISVRGVGDTCGILNLERENLYAKINALARQYARENIFAPTHTQNMQCGRSHLHLSVCRAPREVSTRGARTIFIQMRSHYLSS